MYINKIKRMLTVILLLACQFSFSQSNPNFSFQENLMDSIANKPDSILLVGHGDMNTQIFLDDLSEQLIKLLQKENIHSTYRFLEQTDAAVENSYDTIDKKGYKAVLFFDPKGDSFFDSEGRQVGSRENNDAYVRGVRIPLGGRVDYEQFFSLRFGLLTTTEVTEVWVSSLQVKFDLSKSKNARNVADRLIAIFKKRGYL